MDNNIQALARQAKATGDQHDIDLLVKARMRVGDTEEQALCYLYGHLGFVWWMGAELSQRYANEEDRTIIDWRSCKRCGLVETKEYRARRLAYSTSGTVVVSGVGCSASNVTVPVRSTASPQQMQPTRGSRYWHPTKRRAWTERTRLSKQERRRRRR